MADSIESLSGSQVTKVFRRAAELDAARERLGVERLSVEEVRRAANEAGIHPDATDAALMEVLRDPSDRPAWEVALQRWFESSNGPWYLVAALYAIGFTMALMSR